jgi:hypothetical protein
VIESDGTGIYQLTSSGIAHPPPPERLARILERFAAGAIRLAPDIAVRMLPLPGLGRRFLQARNWFEVELPAGGDGLLATWHGEPPAPPIRLSIGGAAQPLARPERGLAAS